MRNASALFLMLLITCGGILATSAATAPRDRSADLLALNESHTAPTTLRRTSQEGPLLSAAEGAEPPPNDACFNPIDAGALTFFDTRGATTGGETHPSCDGQTYHDIWFRHIAGCTGSMTVTTSSCFSSGFAFAEYDSKIVVYDTFLDCPGGDTLLGCNDNVVDCNGSRVNVPVVEGGGYMIRVGGSAEGDVGFGVLQIFCQVEDCEDGVDNDGDLLTDCADPDCKGVPQCPPDVIVSRIGQGGANDYKEYGTETVDGKEIAAFSASSTSCNPGKATAEFIAGSTARHPVIAQHLYRYLPEDDPDRPYTTFEMIGMSWLKHAFCAVNETTCGTCQSTNCTTLGLGCADTYTALRNGTSTNLGPHSTVNPMGTQFNGVGDGTHSHPFLTPTGPETIVGRLQVHTDDLDPTMNPGARYIMEVQYVTHDEQIADRHNNASWVEVNMPSDAEYVGGIAQAAALVQQSSALAFWKDIESPEVLKSLIEDPDGGRFQIFSNRTFVTATGKWHYEYVVNNFNSHRAAKTFKVDAVTAVEVADMGFHDVDYHSGEGILGTDWAPSYAAGQARWLMDAPFDDIAIANALRWGTSYNFRFDSVDPPKRVKAQLDYYRNDQGSPSVAFVGTGTTHVWGPCEAAVGDADGDVICESSDNCPAFVCDPVSACANPFQSDVDEDGLGDVCDACPDDPSNLCPPQGSAAKEIGSTTPISLVTPDGNITLDLPELSPGPTVSVTQVDEGEVETTYFLIYGSDPVVDDVVAAYSFQPSGLQFDPPASLTIKADVSSISLRQRDNLVLWGETEEVDGEGNPLLRPGEFVCTVEPNTELCAEPCIATCTGPITHFSLHGLSAPKDSDGDGVFDQHPFEQDNCVDHANPDQADCDVDGIGDVCAIAGGSLDRNGNGIPDECELGGECNGACVWDIDTSGDVRVPDLITLLGCWGPLLPAGDPLCPCLDTDGSKDIRVPDLIDLLAKWGPCP